MKSVRFFIESLDGGGAEHILETMVNYIDPKKYKVQVVSQEECPACTVKHKYFFKRNTKGSKLLEFINKVIVKFSLIAPERIVKSVLMPGKYDVEVAFCEGYATKLIGNASKKKGQKKVAWVHTDVLNNPWSEEIFGGAENEKKCYENFDAIICVSQTMKESFVKKYGMEEKVHVLYNVIDYSLIKEKSNEESDFSPNPDTVNFIMVGRLVKVKGYPRLVAAADRLKKEGYSFTVSILGRGAGKDALLNEINAKGLEENIFLLGYQTNPYKFIAASDALICSSYAEGYSTTVTEAIVLGKPVITTDCSGMREIFGNKDCGIICENSEDGLYSALKEVLDRPEAINEYAVNAKNRANDFSIKKRIQELESFLQNL